MFRCCWKTAAASNVFPNKSVPFSYISRSSKNKMAYQTQATSNKSLINSLTDLEIITSKEVKRAMLAVDRGDYVPGGRDARGDAYKDFPVGIGWGATISAPHMHAMALEWLGGEFSHEIFGKEGNGLRGKRVLDVGSGSGYLSACLGEMVFGDHGGTEGKGGEGGEGIVVGIDHIPELRDMAVRNMSKSERGRRFLDGGKIRFVVGDGREGWVDDGEGYDAIHVGAAAVTVHDALINQLRSPGRIFIPVQDTTSSNQYIYVIDKDSNGNVTRKKLCGVNYVPLTDAPR